MHELWLFVKFHSFWKFQVKSHLKKHASTPTTWSDYKLFRLVDLRVNFLIYRLRSLTIQSFNEWIVDDCNRCTRKFDLIFYAKWIHKSTFSSDIRSQIAQLFESNWWIIVVRLKCIWVNEAPIRCWCNDFLVQWAEISIMIVIFNGSCEKEWHLWLVKIR